MDINQFDAITDSLNAEAARLGKKVRDGMAKSHLGYDAFSSAEWREISDEFAALQKRQLAFFTSLGFRV